MVKAMFKLSAFATKVTALLILGSIFLGSAALKLILSGETDERFVHNFNSEDNVIYDILGVVIDHIW